jgi:hypothetical protein
MLTTTTVTGDLQPWLSSAVLPPDTAVFFAPTASLMSTVDKIYVLPSAEPTLPTSTGTFSALLYNTDNEDFEPQPWQWSCVMRAGGRSNGFTFDLPGSIYNEPPYDGTVDITALMPPGFQL